MEKKSVFQIVRCYFDRLLPDRQEHMARRWLSSYSHQAEKDEALRHIWNTLSADADGTTHAALQRVRQRAVPSGNSSKRLMGGILKYAAIIIIAFMAGAGAWIVTENGRHNEAEMAVCRVPNGKKTHLILYDGTSVTLNAGAELRYPRHRTGRTRTVYLTGEGVFNVRHNSAEPFIVKAGSVNIEDVGTRFNVKTLSHGQVITTVTEGCVRINTAKQARNVNVTAGQQAVYSALTGSISVAHADTLLATAWTNGSLVFNHTRLEDIVTDLKHKYNINIVVSPRLPVNRTFTMQLNGNETINDVFMLLAAMGNMHYRIRGNTVWLSPE